jgi:hypothetical protein
MLGYPHLASPSEGEGWIEFGGTVVAEWEAAAGPNILSAPVDEVSASKPFAPLRGREPLTMDFCWTQKSDPSPRRGEGKLGVGGRQKVDNRHLLQFVDKPI